MMNILIRVLVPVISILFIWYMAIFFSGLPAFVIPRPEQVVAVYFQEYNLLFWSTLETLKVAALGFLLANLIGIGTAIVITLLPPTRLALMPSAIFLRNVPYAALVTILLLALGDSLLSKVIVVVLAGFFPVLVNTLQGLISVDDVVLDRLRVLNASQAEIFLKVRLPFALPHILAAQQITGTSSIIVAVSAEWMMSTKGLGYIINRALQTYRGDELYAVALLATFLSFSVYGLVIYLGRKLDWRIQKTQ